MVFVEALAVTARKMGARAWLRSPAAHAPDILLLVVASIINTYAVL